MSDISQLFYGVPIFDGTHWHQNAGLKIKKGMIDAIQPIKQQQVPSHKNVTQLNRGFLAPGLVDIQANGGGGVLLNDDPCLDRIQTICDTHARFGTTAILPTLISDTDIKQEQAIMVVKTACQTMPNCLGLHLEGPYLAKSKHGAHDKHIICSMQDKDIDRLIDAVNQVPTLLVTFAPESVSISRVQQLIDAGIIMSFGHSAASYDEVDGYVQAGVHLVTHLFNAMSGLHHREPGLALAALNLGPLSASLIADGHHVTKEMIALALRAKLGPGQIFLVSDAMATIGTTLDRFQFNDRTIFRQSGRLCLEDGTLAGSDSTLLDGIRYIHKQVGVPLEASLKMASSYPAQAIRQQQHHGHLQPGAYANFIHLSDDLELLGTWIKGQRIA